MLFRTYFRFFADSDVAPIDIERAGDVLVDAESLEPGSVTVEYRKS
jgi:hypothetical protein